MCTPMAAVAVGGSLLQGQAAKKQARGQAAYNHQLSIARNENYQRQVDYQYELADWQEDNYNKAAESIHTSATGQYATVLEQVGLVRDKTLDNIATAARAASKGRSYVLAAASESGTQGNSIALAQQQYELQEARYTHNAFTNLETSLKQAQRNLLGIQAQSQSRLNAAMPAPMAPIDPAQPTQQVSAPSMLPYMLQGANGALGAMAQQNQLEALQALNT